MKKIIQMSLLALLIISLKSLSSPVYADNKDKDGDHPGGHYPDYHDFYRLDCRFHNDEHLRGANFCYASAVYQIEHEQFKNVHLGVGCDNQTIFYDKARVQIETTLDRFSPLRAATPGLEIFPQGQLTTEGTYTAKLDIPIGRLKGLCYVHKMR